MQIIEPIGKFGQELFIFLLPEIERLTHINDFSINIFILVFILNYMINYIVVKFAPLTSHIKLTLMVAVLFGVLASMVTQENHSGEQVPIENLTRAAGELWLWATLILSTYTIMTTPYYEGLFGRFRDRD